ncbi:MAG: hypothetical protein ABIJ61_10110 [bacterium]
MSGILLIDGYSLAFNAGYLWLIALIFLIAIGLTWLYYRRTNPPLPGSRRLVLGLLRGLAIATLFFVLAEPLLVRKSVESKPPIAAVLIDNSRSMAGNQLSEEQFADLPEYLNTVESRFGPETELRYFTFADTLRPGREVDGSGEATALGDALRYLATEVKEENLQSVVLLSDGSSNLGVNPASAAKSLGVPVNTVGFGNPNPLPDVQLIEVDHNATGFADKEFEIAVTVESRGFEDVRIPIRVRHNGRNLTQQEITLAGGGRRQTETLKFMPPGEGTYTFEISLPAQESEDSDKNNSKQIQVRFRKSRIKILLASAYLNWEFKFLKQVLSANEDFEVIASIESNRKLENTQPFPENVEALGEFDALLLLDFPPEWFEHRRQILDAFFERTGTGAFILAAENLAANPGNDYVDALLPYRFARRSPKVVAQEAFLQPTEQGRIHPLLRLSGDPTENDRLLATLPPFGLHLQATGTAPGATILATAPAANSGDEEVPLLGVKRYRTGKVALLSAFPLWKLHFLARSFDESDNSYATLMQNLVLWLVARDDQQRIAIAPERPILIAGEPVELSAQVLDESFLPLPDAQVEASLINEDHPEDTLIVSFLPDRPGQYHARLPYLSPGKYEIKGRVQREGLVLGNPTNSMVVEPFSLEDLSRVADFDMLKSISRVSGGEFVAATDTAQLAAQPVYLPREQSRISESALFDNPILLGIFIAAICAEWYLRRRYQLL